VFPVVNFLKCVFTEVVLFSIVAFKTVDISQGCVFSDSFYKFSHDSESEIMLKIG